MALRWLRNKLTSHNLYTTVFHTKWVIIKCEDMFGHHYKKFLTPLKLLKEQLLKMLLKLSSKIQTIQLMWNGGQVSSSVTDFQWRKQMVPHLDWTSCLFFSPTMEQCRALNDCPDFHSFFTRGGKWDTNKQAVQRSFTSACGHPTEILLFT